MSDEFNEVQEEVVTIKKDDYDFLKKCVVHFKDQAEMKELELEELKKQLAPQSLDLELEDLESLRSVLVADTNEDRLNELIQEMN